MGTEKWRIFCYMGHFTLRSMRLTSSTVAVPLSSSARFYIITFFFFFFFNLSLFNTFGSDPKLLSSIGLNQCVLCGCVESQHLFGLTEELNCNFFFFLGNSADVDSVFLDRMDNVFYLFIYLFFIYCENYRKNKVNNDVFVFVLKLS
jgi:hypothetical protein